MLAIPFYKCGLCQQLVLTIASSWASLLKPYVQKAIFSFYQVQNMNPCPSHSPKHRKRPIIVTALAFDLCVLYYRIPCTLSNRISGKEGDFNSTYIYLVVRQVSWIALHVQNHTLLGHSPPVQPSSLQPHWLWVRMPQWNLSKDNRRTPTESNNNNIFLYYFSKSVYGYLTMCKIGLKLWCDVIIKRNIALQINVPNTLQWLMCLWIQAKMVSYVTFTILRNFLRLCLHGIRKCQ